MIVFVCSKMGSVLLAESVHKVCVFMHVCARACASI